MNSEQLKAFLKLVEETKAKQPHLADILDGAKEAAENLNKPLLAKDLVPRVTEQPSKFGEGFNLSETLRKIGENDLKKKLGLAGILTGAAGATNASAADLDNYTKDLLSNPISRGTGDVVSEGSELVDKVTGNPFRAGLKAASQGENPFKAAYANQPTTGREVADSLLKGQPGLSMKIGNEDYSPAKDILGLGVDLIADPTNLPVGAAIPAAIMKLGSKEARASKLLEHLKKLGYEFKLNKNSLLPERMEVLATKDGAYAGHADLTPISNNLHPEMINVHNDHKGEGLGSGMYAFAEKELGKTLQPGSIQTVQGGILHSKYGQGKIFGEKDPTLQRIKDIEKQLSENRELKDLMTNTNEVKPFSIPENSILEELERLKYGDLK